MSSVNLAAKFRLFDEYWSPKIVGELNDCYVKLVKLKGEFVWHQHDVEDELFLVVKGRLLLKFRDRDVSVGEGEFIIVPRGVEHLPVASAEDRKSTRLNSSHSQISYAVFCLKKKKKYPKNVLFEAKKKQSVN